MSTAILWATLGGGLIGLAASWLLLSRGHLSGISGITASVLHGDSGKHAWKTSFITGLLSGGAILFVAMPNAFRPPDDRPIEAIVAAGILVGFGTRLGSGCTSGHGICGLSRFSTRSLVATTTFMATGFLMATLWGLST